MPIRLSILPIGLLTTALKYTNIQVEDVELTVVDDGGKFHLHP